MPKSGGTIATGLVLLAVACSAKLKTQPAAQDAGTPGASGGLPTVCTGSFRSMTSNPAASAGGLCGCEIVQLNPGNVSITTTSCAEGLACIIKGRFSTDEGSSSDDRFSGTCVATQEAPCCDCSNDATICGGGDCC
jgi:hypothetical protein